ncbi:MAG TPA: hypothetical protein VFI42_15530 [Thermomicrobiaceae bacterium]|nr:hypothetical protein [Thermomicrobiaceae bacterium]
MQDAGVLLGNAAWSPDGSNLAAAYALKGVDLLDLDGTRRTTLDGYPGAVASVAWAPHGGLLAAATQANSPYAANGGNSLCLWRAG